MITINHLPHELLREIAYHLTNNLEGIDKIQGLAIASKATRIIHYEAVKQNNIVKRLFPINNQQSTN